MSTVISIRVPRELKDALEKLDRIDWQRELRAFLEEKVRRELRARQLEEAKKLRDMMKSVSAAEIIREDRDKAH